MRLMICVLAGLMLTACGPELPVSGTASPFDGKWSGTASGDQAGCSFTIEADVKFGKLVGEIRDGAKLGDVWGDIGPDGKLEGQLGVAGVRNASAEIVLDAESGTGEGTYASAQCNGTLTLARS